MDVREALKALLDYWLMADSVRRVHYLGLCANYGESTRFQCILPNPWSHRWKWLNSAGHKTDGKS